MEQRKRGSYQKSRKAERMHRGKKGKNGERAGEKGEERWRWGKGGRGWTGEGGGWMWNLLPIGGHRGDGRGRLGQVERSIDELGEVEVQ